MTPYPLTPPSPPADLTIHIRRVATGHWLPVKLLGLRGAWVVVDDGEGPLWVMLDHVSREDWPAVWAFERLRERRN